MTLRILQKQIIFELIKRLFYRVVPEFLKEEIFTIIKYMQYILLQIVATKRGIITLIMVII
jgi:hypothetical protein